MDIGMTEVVRFNTLCRRGNDDTERPLLIVGLTFPEEELSLRRLFLDGVNTMSSSFGTIPTLELALESVSLGISTWTTSDRPEGTGLTADERRLTTGFT